MPSRFVLKGMNAVHKGLLAVSFGRIGWNAGNMPVLKLITTGRTSGIKREVMLTSPLQIGDTWVIVASKGGDLGAVRVSDDDGEAFVVPILHVGEVFAVAL